MATDFLSMDCVSNDELEWLLEAGRSYADRAYVDRDRSSLPLQGRTVAMIFEKPSLRTKVSFDIAAYELGGHAVYLGADEVGLDKREPVEDVGRVLERWASVIVARVMAHSTLERLAASASVPVINALSDVEHPCQAVADLLTVRQHKGRVAGLKVAYVGDANNCALSLGLGALALGADFAIASPDGYAFSDADAAKMRARGNGQLTLTGDPDEAASQADVVYTDVWTSMGQEEESAERRRAFRGLSGERASHVAGQPRRADHASDAGSLRRGDGAGDAESPAVRCVRRGRESPARAEGRAAAAGRRRVNPMMEEEVMEEEVTEQGSPEFPAAKPPRCDYRDGRTSANRACSTPSSAGAPPSWRRRPARRATA